MSLLQNLCAWKKFSGLVEVCNKLLRSGLGDLDAAPHCEFATWRSPGHSSGTNVNKSCIGSLHSTVRASSKVVFQAVTQLSIHESSLAPLYNSVHEKHPARELICGARMCILCRITPIHCLWKRAYTHFQQECTNEMYITFQS